MYAVGRVPGCPTPRSSFGFADCSILVPTIIPWFGIGMGRDSARKQGLWDKVQDRLVMGENIAQTAQFVETGSADVGILAHSLTQSPRMRDKGRSWTIPADAHPKLEQGGVIMTWAQDKAAAQVFKEFLVAEGRRVATVWFDLPGSDHGLTAPPNFGWPP